MHVSNLQLIQIAKIAIGISMGVYIYSVSKLITEVLDYYSVDTISAEIQLDDNILDDGFVVRE